MVCWWISRENALGRHDEGKILGVLRLRPALSAAADRLDYAQDDRGEVPRKGKAL